MESENSMEGGLSVSLRSVSRRTRIGATLVAGLLAAIGIAGGLLATHAHAATKNRAAAPKAYAVAVTLKAVAGSGHGTFTGRVSSVNATSGTLIWKLVFSGLSGPATGTQIRLSSAAGKVLAHLCAPCASGVHKTTVFHGAVYREIAANKGFVTVSTKAHPTGELVGALKLKLSTTGGGGTGTTTVPVTPALVAAGKKYAAHYNCEGCHTINGQKSTGPTWKGLAGSKVHQTDGTTVTATDSYLIRIITDPSTAKVEGYDSGVMAEVIAPGEVSDAQARAIVAYIKTLK